MFPKMQSQSQVMVYPPWLVLFQLQFKVIITCNSYHNKTEKHCDATETS